MLGEFVPTKTLSVLVIDDDLVDRLLVRELISTYHQVLEAKDGPEASKHMQSRPVDCVLLDYRIPGTDSLALLAEYVDASVPVIMLTGDGNEEIAVAALKAGASDYIRKGGLSDSRLLQTIATSVDRAVLRRELARKQEQLAVANDALHRKVMELENLNGDLQNFIHIAAHDFREPLRAMANYSDLLQLALGDSCTAERLGFLDGIRRGARQLVALIDDLRAMSRVGLATHGAEEVALEELVTDVLLEFEAELKARKVHTARTVLPCVRGVRILLRELFYNLISNALKYGDPTALRLYFSGHSSEDGIATLGVRNSGCSIGPHEVEHLFQPFSRVSNAGTKEGTGLGLMLCKRIVERAGGTIWVEFPTKNEIEFRFTLRLAHHGSTP